jgi:hypothetical protein
MNFYIKYTSTIDGHWCIWETTPDLMLNRAVYSDSYTIETWQECWVTEKRVEHDHFRDNTIEVIAPSELEGYMFLELV